MSVEYPRPTSIDNTSAADDFDSAVEQHLGYASETAGGIEVAQAETPDATRTDRLPAQTPPVEVAAATIPTEVKPNEQNVVTLPAGIELDNLEFEVDGENLVLVLADGTEIVVLGGAANIPTFVIGDVELPQVALFAALEGSNINVAAGPDGTFSAQGTPSASRNFNDDPIDAGPEDLALADLLGDTSFGDELRTGVVFGGDGRPSIPSPLTESFIYDEAVIAGGEGQKIITGRLPFNPGPDSGAISAIGFVGASDVNEGDGLKVLTGFTSGGLPISVTGVSAALTGPDFVALEGRDSDGGLVFTISVNRATGDFTFELVGKLEHPDAGQNGSQDDLDDLLRLGFTYTVTDLDGDFVVGSFNIDVQDDAPVANFSGTTVVTEEGSAAGAFVSQSATGTLSFDAGADGAKVTNITYRFGGSILEMQEGTSDPESFPALTSGGKPVVVVTSADGLTVTGTITVDGVAKPVFTLVVTNAQTGAYTFTQTAPIDHPDRNEGGADDSLRMVFDFVVTDGDGDAATSQVQVDIRDDVPVANFSGTTVVTEDGSAAGAFVSQSATGTLSFDAGADGAKVTNITYRFGGSILEMQEGTSDPQSFPALTSGGKPVVVVTSADGLTVTGTITVDGVAKPVFTLVVTNVQTGAYTFTQTAPIDHPDRNEGGADDSLRMVFDFVVTDGDGDTATSQVQVDIRDDVPVANFSGTTVVTEDGSAAGAFVSQSATGTLSFDAGADGAKVTNITYRFGGSILEMEEGAGDPQSFPALTSGGKPVVVVTSADGLTVTGTITVDGVAKPVFTLVVTNVQTGAYTFTQTAPIDHPDSNEGGADDSLRMVFDFVVTDGDGDTSTNEVKVDIRDDVPVAVGESATVREASPVVGGNLILAFDVSGSMDEDAVTNGRYESKLDVAKAAALNLLASSDAASVLIVTFNDSARSSIWMSKADAIAYINGQIPNEAGGTNYDSAIQAIMTSAKPASTVYFFSDGNAGGGSYSLDDAETVAWQNFVNSNGMTSYAVGVGSGLSANDADLSDVAHPGNPIVITTANDAALLATVVPTPQMPTTASGFVLDNDSFGADGGRIQSIVVDGVTHTWDGTEGNKVLNVTTALGGSLIFNFKTGAWSYAAPSELVSDTAETFTYKLVDGDGDTKTADLVLNLKAVNDGPVNTVPASLNAFEDTELAIAGVQINDVDAGNGSMTVKLEVKEGELKIGSTVGSTITLTGTVAEINAALLGLKYKGDLNFNGADQLKITTTDNGNTGLGGAKSDVDTVTINVAAVNDAPELLQVGGTLKYEEGDGTAQLDKSIVISDVDDTYMTGATVQITGSYQNGQDFLRFATQNGITGSWDASTGTLTLSGVATKERYEQALESVRYENTSQDPSTQTRTVTFSVTDGDVWSNLGTVSVEVKAENDAPVASGDRVITNAGVGTTFEIPDWALLFNDTDVDSDDLSVTSISNRSGLNANTSADGVIVIDTGNSGGSFDYRAYDGEDQSSTARVTVEQRTSGPLDGTSGNDILVGVAKPAGQITTIKFADSYDVGDVVKVTLDGKTFSHTVVTGGTSVSAVYTALLAATPVGSVQTLQQLLAAEGIDQTRVGSTVTWTGDPGAQNAFSVVASVDNSNDVGAKWHYEVDFSSLISWFEASGSIAIKIGNNWYSENANNSGVSNDIQRFDKTAEALAGDLRVLGFDVTYNSITNDFLIKSSASTSVDGAYRVKSNRDWIDADVDLVQTGSSPSNQPNPVVDTIQDADDGGLTLNGLGGHDILIGSDADDVLNGGSGDDILFGGLGLDTMTGGTGADTFVFDETAFEDIDVTDVITDYSLAQGDMLDVSALLDSLLGETATQAQRMAAVDTRVEGGNTFVTVGTGSDAQDIAMLNGVHDVKILFDDKHASTIAHD